MSLNEKIFPEIVSDLVTAVQAKASSLVDTAIGSICLAMCEANAGVVMWIQSLIVTLLTTIRAATCSGDALDTWFADFGFTREGATYSTGPVTFSRFTATYQAVIPVGSTVTTTDGTQSFLVLTDTTNPAYSASLGGYVVAAGVASVTVTVQAVTAGSAGNVSAGSISVISGGIQYIDTVTNTNAFTNGSDAETDDNARARFRLWISSLSKGTLAAVQYAIASIQTGVSYQVVENQNYTGATQNGFFYAVVDDGSGSPTSAFLATVYTAIDAVRGLTISFAVFPPSLLSANIAMTITTSSAATHSDVVALVNTAISEYVATLTLGQMLPVTKLASLAYGASPYVTNVSNITLNGLTADLSASVKQVIRAGTIVVS